MGHAKVHFSLTSAIQDFCFTLTTLWQLGPRVPQNRCNVNQNTLNNKYNNRENNYLDENITTIISEMGHVPSMLFIWSKYVNFEPPPGPDLFHLRRSWW